MFAVVFLSGVVVGVLIAIVGNISIELIEEEED